MVDHRHDLLCDLGFSSKRRGLNISCNPLAEVLEISLSPLGQFQILISLLVSVSKQRVEVRFNLASLGLIRLPRGWRRFRGLPR
jgi:hypothetical protein